MHIALKGTAVLAWIGASFWTVGVIFAGQAGIAIVSGLLAIASTLLGLWLWRQARRQRVPMTGARDQLRCADPRLGPPQAVMRQSTAPPPVTSATRPTGPPHVIPSPRSQNQPGRTIAPTTRTLHRARRGQYDDNSGNSGIRRAGLTRGHGVPARDVVFSVVDLETTGLEATSDRIVEIGIVKIRGDGVLIDEFGTLVAVPQVGASALVHGIVDDDLVGAPTWEQVWPEVEQLISGTVLVAHNLNFEQSFLEAEARRIGRQIPVTPGVCTLVEARRQLDGHAFSLKSLHKTVSGSWRNDDHTALGDARATRDLLLWLLRSGPTTLSLSGAPPVSHILDPSPSTPVLFRSAGWGARSVSALVAAFPDSPRARTLDVDTLRSYEHELNLALNDGRLTGAEAERLSSIARRLGATSSQLRQIHRRALDEIRNAPDDVPLTTGQTLELAQRLGLNDFAGQLQQTAPVPVTLTWTATLLRSWRIAIVGDSPELTRLREQATTYGVRIAKNVTKTVRFTATDAPDEPASALLTSRKYNVPVIAVADAAGRLTDAIAAAVREFEASEKERKKFDDEHSQRMAEADLYWRHAWRRTELLMDPGPGSP